MQHPYAHVLRAIADGETIQSVNNRVDWVSRDPATVLEEISDREYGPEHYRVKPRTITINGHEVPEPLREAPPKGMLYFLPAVISPHGDNATKQVWTGVGACPRWLQQGLVHLTAEAAQAHAEALLSFTKQP